MTSPLDETVTPPRDGTCDDRLLLLGEMSLRFHRATTEREVYAAACACIARVLPGDHAGVSLYREATGDGEMVALESEREPVALPPPLPIAGTAFEMALREDRAVIRDDVPPTSMQSALARIAIRSILHVPIHDGDRPYGTIHASSKRSGVFGPSEAALLTQVSELVSANVARIRLLAETLRARAEAEEASRAKSEYLAHLSHEIRTPLNGVIGMISLLQQTPLNAEQVEYVHTLRASGDALLSIVSDVLDFSKIEAHQVELEDRAFEARSVVRDAVDIVSAQARQRGLELSAEVDPSVPTYSRGDPFRVQQVLVNLLSNAVKFTRHGKVLVRLEADANLDPDAPVTLRFRVQDTGIGIPADRLDRLFKPFTQGDRSTARRYGGTGLGLAISKRLCELMGGSISAETVHGRGTTFTFTVRVRRSDSGEAPPAQRDSLIPAPERSGLRVLVAEDNPVNQRVAEMMLRKNGFSVDVVSNGLEALEALERQRYAVVLMDVQMPELDGLEATRRIVERWGVTRPKIIAMTANALRGDRELCLEAGMDDYVDKPARAHDLVAAIGRVLALSL